ncbi:hypothetical protein K435DRAFT_909827 [Dendrothele bispora CBS 962.96]|uniref:Conidiation protein 6 n=1 Tax=Dendrothele bispora (strain CBS 962.96) TaxID=1314807 RepID=A0A4S8LQ37_DENBC|nr:hypothetical protein K435DRAFT_909827 [Dendrothele bispora CBS 962.96]
MSFVDGKNPNNVMGGLKATINNPKVSDEAKESAKERLNEMAESGYGRKEATPDLNDKRVVGGYKATLHNDRVSDEAKAHAREMIDAAGVSEDSQSRSYTTEGEEHENHVLGGYKGTLKNPNVSESAKEHARDVLDDHDAL